MSASETSISSNAPVPHHRHDHDHAADDHVDPARLETRDCDGAARSARSRACGRSPRPRRATGGSDRCARSRSRRHRARSRRSSTRCRRSRSASSAGRAPGTARSTSARWSRTTDTATLSSSALGGSECRNCSVRRTQPTSIEIRPVGLVGADDELGRAAADVDHEIGLGLARARPSRRELEPRFFLAAEELGPYAEQLLDRIEEVVAVRRVARGARRGGAHARRRRARRSPPGTRSITATVRAIASGSSRRVWLTPWPSRVICVRRSTVDEPSCAVDVGDEEPARSWCRCRRRRPGVTVPHPRRAAPRPTGRPDRRRRRDARRSARAGT